MKRILLICSILCYIHNGFSQNKEIDSLLFTSFDKTTDLLNSKLSYGLVFEEKWRKKIKNNHNFFLSDLFQKGNIHYRGEYFFDIKLKYDIVDDLVIARITNQQQKTSIVLEKNFINKFQLNNFNFVNTFPQDYGFLEIIFVADNFSILKKHQKVSNKNTDFNFIYHTFKKKKDKYFLFLKNYYFQIESKKDFIKIFPNQKEKIIKYFKTNSTLQKNNYKTFVIKLMNQLQVKK